jgi:hypothetical protein
LYPPGVQSDANPLHPFRQAVERLLQNPEKMLVGREVTVPELRMSDQLLFCPPDVHGLVCPMAFIAQEGFFLGCLYDHCIGVEGSRGGGTLLVYRTRSRLMELMPARAAE